MAEDQPVLAAVMLFLCAETESIQIFSERTDHFRNGEEKAQMCMTSRSDEKKRGRKVWEMGTFLALWREQDKGNDQD